MCFLAGKNPKVSSTYTMSLVAVVCNGAIVDILSLTTIFWRCSPCRCGFSTCQSSIPWWATLIGLPGAGFQLFRFKLCLPNIRFNNGWEKLLFLLDLLSPCSITSLWVWHLEFLHQMQHLHRAARLRSSNLKSDQANLSISEASSRKKKKKNDTNIVKAIDQ